MKYLIGILFLFSFIPSAKAGAMTAGQLNTECKAAAIWSAPNSSPDEKGAVSSGLCTGFMIGFLQTAPGLCTYDSETGKTQVIMMADDVTPGQIERVFLKYMSEHPEDENKPAYVGVVHALANAKLTWTQPVPQPKIVQ